MTQVAACSCCSAPLLKQRKPGNGVWCAACVDACSSVRQSLKGRLREAIRDGNEACARIVQGALLMLLRGRNPWAPR